jgi:hypothetical protein
MLRLLRALAEPMSRRRLQQALELRNDAHFRKACLNPALQKGWIEMSPPPRGFQANGTTVKISVIRPDDQLFTDE